jgi:hypothetical protein
MLLANKCGLRGLMKKLVPISLFVFMLSFVLVCVNASTFEAIQERASQGDAAAQLDLGKMYYFG